MINLKDQADVQIWCDFQEEIQQTNTNFFLRLRFANFNTFVSVANNNYDDGFSYGSGYGDGDDGFSNGGGFGNYDNGNGKGFGEIIVE